MTNPVGRRTVLAAPGLLTVRWTFLRKLHPAAAKVRCERRLKPLYPTVETAVSCGREPPPTFESRDTAH